MPKKQNGGRLGYALGPECGSMTSQSGGRLGYPLTVATGAAVGGGSKRQKKSQSKKKDNTRKKQSQSGGRLGYPLTVSTGAAVGGGSKQQKKRQTKSKKRSQKGGRLGYALGSECGSMTGQSGGGDTWMVERIELKNSQRGGGDFTEDAKAANNQRLIGIIENMIHIGDSSDADIIEVLRNETDETGRKLGGDATKYLREYYLLNTQYQTHNHNNKRRRYPSTLLNDFIKANQRGGNRAVLPITFFSTEIASAPNTPIQLLNMDRYAF